MGYLNTEEVNLLKVIQTKFERYFSILLNSFNEGLYAF